jgi:hypothetical protein
MTYHDNTILPVDSSLFDDSENAAAPMTISKESIRTMMPKGWNGRIALHSMLWWGRPNHPDIGVNDMDPATVINCVVDMIERGYDILIPDWYHPTKTTCTNDSVIDLWASACTNHGLNYLLMIDQQYFGNQGSTPETMQADIISAINHLMDRYASDPGYEHYTFNGVSRPVLFLWNVVSVAGKNVDWNEVSKAVVPHFNPLLVQYQASGFEVDKSDGSFSWIDSDADTEKSPSGVLYLTDSFFPACDSHPDLIHATSFWSGFNGTLTGNVSWSLGKYIPQNGGQTWIDILAANSAYVEGGGRIDFLCNIIWDDFEEGSATQGGLRTDVTISASSSGDTIAFTIKGTEATVRQYNLWGTRDGVVAYLLSTVIPGEPKEFSVRGLDVPLPGVYTLYVEAQGMPSLQNHMAEQSFKNTF